MGDSLAIVSAPEGGLAGFWGHVRFGAGLGNFVESYNNKVIRY